MASHKKGKGFAVVSRELTREEKIQRANDFNDFNGEMLVDPEEFAKEKIYDSYVEMKCLDCGHEEQVDFGDVLERLEMTGGDYPVYFCPECEHETLVPKSIYEEKKST